MSASISLYRKYRSQTFDELVGQEPVVRTLKNAIATGRIAHAYLFTGPRGVGKTSAARLLARAANCLSDSPDKPCNECANCLAATRDIATDLIEIDAASNTGVDNIREVIERAQFSPSVWHTKFYIIDEVHMLSVSAFNALLKTLEEPPPQVSFILATTEVHKVPATVASRCQRFDFRRVPLSAMLQRLQFICEREGMEAEKAALELVARNSTGSLRDAESLLDQLRVFAEGPITLKSVQDLLGASGSEKVADFVDSIVAGDLATGLRQIDSVLEEGLDLRQFNRQVVEHLRALMLLRSGAAGSDEASLLDVTEEMRARMTAQASQVTIADLLRWVKAFADADATLRSTSYKQLPLEMALVASTLKPEETTSVQAPAQVARPQSQPQTQVAAPSHTPPPARDRSAEIAAGAEQIGLPPRKRPEAAPPREAPSYVSAPPPIHADLGMVNGNGHGDAERETRNAEPAPPDAVQFDEDIPAPEPGASYSSELDKLQSLWPQVVDQIQARSRNIAVVFKDSNLVKPVGISGNLCTISFRYPIQAERCRKEPWRGIIEQSISRVIGRQLVVESVTFDGKEAGLESDDPFGRGAPKSGAPNGAKERPSPYETTRGKAAMNIFGITKFDEPGS